jgi:CheY-like chemotaxis protein
MAGRILIVDDDDDIRESLRTVLELEGYEVQEAANGRAAQELLEDVSGVRPSMILLDLMMPVMNGLEFHAWLKETPGVSDIPVVIFSAAGANIARPEGVQAFLRKPLELTELLTLTEKYAP